MALASPHCIRPCRHGEGAVSWELYQQARFPLSKGKGVWWVSPVSSPASLRGSDVGIGLYDEHVSSFANL